MKHFRLTAVGCVGSDLLFSVPYYAETSTNSGLALSLQMIHAIAVVRRRYQISTLMRAKLHPLRRTTIGPFLPKPRRLARLAQRRLPQALFRIHKASRWFYLCHILTRRRQVVMESSNIFVRLTKMAPEGHGRRLASPLLSSIVFLSISRNIWVLARRKTCSNTIE